MRLKAVIFDFDGVILDTEAAEFASWSDLYREHGVALRFEDWVVCVGSAGLFDPVGHLDGLTGTTHDRAAVVERFRAINRPRLDGLPVLPGVLGILDEAASLGLATAIASSSPPDWVEGHLGRLGLRNRFGVVSTRTDGVPAKPAPDIYLRALARLGLAAGEAVALEDSMNGIAGAKAAGLYCVAIPNGVTARLDLTRADRRVGSLVELSLGDLGRTVFNGAAR